MNEQNSDSSTTSTSSPTAPISEKLSETKKTKQSLLKKWFHKTESIPPVSSATPAAIESPQTPPLPKKRISFF